MPMLPSEPHNVNSNTGQSQQEFFSMSELAQRWRCSRGTVYNRLRAVGAKVLDFAPRGKRGKKVVPIRTILEVERSRMNPLR